LDLETAKIKKEKTFNFSTEEISDIKKINKE
jgi:hypothetical protein